MIVMNKLAIIVDDANTAIDLINKHQDENVLFEFRIDLDPNLLKLLAESSIDTRKIIATIRSIEEGGEPCELNREETLKIHSQLNLKYLDYEIMRDDLPDIGNSTTLIASKHDYSTSMFLAAKKYIDDIGEINDNIIYKFVGKPLDTVDFIDSYHFLVNKLPRSIILGIGKNAEISRTSYKQELVFGSQKPGPVMSYEKLASLDDNAIKLGLLGEKLDYSLSPKIHQYFMGQKKISGHYHLLEASHNDRASRLIDELINLGFKGINITTPYKRNSIDHATKLSDDVVLSNAANTLLFGDQVLAENTDVFGFEKFMTQNKFDKFGTAAILGGGGAARSVAVALLKHDIEVTIINRSLDRFEEVLPDLRDQIDLKVLEKDECRADIFIDATTLGFQGISSRQFFSSITAKVIVDLSYSHQLTPLLTDFSKINDVELYDGREMLVYQAEKAFNLWLGTDLDLDFADVWEGIK